VGKAVRIAAGSVVFRDTDQRLTTTGQWTLMAGRALGPILIALTALAIRARETLSHRPRRGHGLHLGTALSRGDHRRDAWGLLNLGLEPMIKSDSRAVALRPTRRPTDRTSQ
jgi:hypothetical protein